MLSQKKNNIKIKISIFALMKASVAETRRVLMV